jgi:VanZ family protein
MLNWVKQDKQIFFWTPVILWGALILIFSVLPGKVVPTLSVGHFDKMAHFFEFAVLSLLVVRSSHRSRVTSFYKIILFALISSSVYGIVMELLQGVIPGRVSCIYDVYANITGTIFGIILGGILIWRK